MIYPNVLAPTPEEQYLINLTLILLLFFRDILVTEMDYSLSDALPNHIKVVFLLPLLFSQARAM